MRDRAFGVEIECGYYGPGMDREPSCSCQCWCDSERDYMRLHNDRFGKRYTQEDIDTFQCEFCRYGCEGCEDSYEYSEGCEVAADLLSRNGFEHWLDDIHEDGSGVEIPSPILRGPQGLRELRNVMQLLSENGFRAGRADGMHVHHDAPEFTDEGLLAHTVELWEDNFEHITRFVDPARRGTTWASPRHERGYAERYEEFKKSKKIADLPSWRTCALNIMPLRCHEPNIEIRLHEGTLDFRKAAAWIHFGQAFLWAAMRSYQKREVRVCADSLEVLRMANVRGNSRRVLMEVAALS
ncbi:MAG TPA: amidoligase family protein [Nitrospira sp.]|nr:amidoligase family protein [Nitrospira sp.]